MPWALLFSIENNLSAVHASSLRMRGITWETGGIMTMTRPMYAYACQIRPSRVCLWSPRTQGVISPDCLHAAVTQGLDVID
jgi:hypothetical protein